MSYEVLHSSKLQSAPFRFTASVTRAVKFREQPFVFSVLKSFLVRSVNDDARTGGFATGKVGNASVSTDFRAQPVNDRAARMIAPTTDGAST